MVRGVWQLTYLQMEVRLVKGTNSSGRKGAPEELARGRADEEQKGSLAVVGLEPWWSF